MKFETDEEWEKVYGPVFMYLNSLAGDGGDPLQELWEDAKNQVFSLFLFLIYFIYEEEKRSIGFVVF